MADNVVFALVLLALFLCLLLVYASWKRDRDCARRQAEIKGYMDCVSEQTELLEGLPKPTREQCEEIVDKWEGR